MMIMIMMVMMLVDHADNDECEWSLFVGQCACERWCDGDGRKGHSHLSLKYSVVNIIMK